MYKIAVIGSQETVMGFQALGLAAFPAADTEDAKKILRRLTKAGETYAIIYLEETFATGMTAEIDRFKDAPTPAIIFIPGKNGSLGLGQTALKAAVERAVGTDIS